MKYALQLSLLLVLCSALYLPAQEKTGGDFSEESIQYDFALGLLRRGLATDAATEFSRFLKQFPNSKRAQDALLQRAQSYFAANKFKEAANDYYAWINNTRSNDPQIRLRYGICLYELGNLKNALAVFNAITEKESTDAAAYYSGLCLQKNGDLKKAIDEFSKITTGPLHASALFSYAQCLQDLKDYTKAAKTYWQIINKYPTHALAEKSRLARANALRLAGKLGQSSQGFNELAKSSDQRVRERALYGLAWTKLEESKINEAIKLAQDVLKTGKDPQLKTGSHYLLGTAYFRQNNFAKSQQQYALALKGEFHDKAALGMGWTLYKADKPQEALTYLSKIPATSSPQLQGEGWYITGRCHWKLKQYKTAATDFAKAAALSSSRTEQALYEQALSLEKAKADSKAAEVYEQFIQKYPQSTNIHSALSGLGRSLIAAQRYEAATMIYTRLLAKSNLEPAEKQAALERQAVAYYYLKQYENMSRSYQKLLNEFPKSESAQSALYWLGWHNLDNRNYPAAIRYYKKLIDTFPQSRFTARSRYYLGSAYLRSGKEQLAAKLFYSLSGEEQNPLEERELLWLGRFLQESKQQEKAQKVYSRILSRSKDRVMQSLALRGLALSLQQQQKWAESLKQFDQLFLTSTKIIGQASTAQAFSNEALLGAAIALREMDKPNEAEKKLNTLRVSADDPFMAKVLFERGRLAFARKEYNKATALLMRVGLLVADEDLAGEALWLAGQACETNGDLRKARLCYEELAGKTEGGYGKIYKGSPYTDKAIKRLAQLDKSSSNSQPKPGKNTSTINK